MKHIVTIHLLCLTERKKLLAFLAICMIVASSFMQVKASDLMQPQLYKGVVKDGFTNELLPGVNIIIKGSKQGTVTDINGSFSINASVGQVLEISFIGYLKEEIELGSATQLEIILSQDITSLDEVVVIGYGVQKKKLVTGATSQVKGEELQKTNSTNALLALQGKASGINITSESGQPGEGLKVTIRGLGTIGKSQPLYLVDGVATSDIKYLNTSDIESIDVLKDAASAAIYGSRAANGVVIITTKSGRSGKQQISFDAYYGFQNLAKKVDMLNAKEYATIMNEQHLNSGGNVSSLPFDLNNLPAYVEEGSMDQDWIDKMFVKNAITQNYSLGATGGNESGNYAMSLSYTGQEGIVGGKDNSNYERYTGRINSENKLYNNRIKVGQHLSFAYIKKNGVSVGDQYSNTLRGAFNASPFIPDYSNDGELPNTTEADSVLLDKNGKPYWNETESNPYIGLLLNNQNLSATTKVIGDIYAEIEIIKNLKVRSTFGVDYASEDYRKFEPSYTLSVYNFREFSRAQQKLTKDLAINMDNILTYDFVFGNHSFNAMAGMSARKYNGSFLDIENSDLIFHDLDHAFMDNAKNQDWAKLSIKGGPNENNDDKLLSYFGRLQYNFKETYLLNATLRFDASSKFGPSNRWAPFPSISGGWVISNEDFMIGTASVINFLKIRASWGRNGNQDITNFNFLAPISFENVIYAFGNVEGANTQGSYPSRLGNDAIKWETSEQLNLGIDARIFSSDFSVVLDWYSKNTKDWLIKAPVLATFGAEAPFINGGNVINTGVELGLGYNKQLGNFGFSLNANAAYNKNKVEDIPTEDGIVHGATNSLYNNSLEFYRAETGYPIGYFWGYATDGIFQSSGEVSNYMNNGKIVQPNAKPGDLKYIDQDKNGTIDEDDKVMIGDPNPDFIYGFNFSCDFMGIDVSLIANGVAGNQIVQSYRNPGDRYANYTTEILDRWHGNGTSNTIPRVTNSNVNYQFSDVFIKEGSYLRISNFTIGYDLANMLHLNFISQFRIFSSIQNAFTFTKYSGMDPEVGYGFDNEEDDKFSRGIDLGFYPRPRTVIVGLGLKF